MERRQFIKVTAVAGGGLVFGFSCLAQSNNVTTIKDQKTAEPVELDALIKITPDNHITVVLNRIEMGQGVDTGLPMLIAEELDADWDLVSVEKAQVNETKYGIQSTTASISISSGWDFCREAGAKVRSMLINAAAIKWHVSADNCYAENSYVFGPDGRKATFGELATAASTSFIPDKVTLKDPSNFKLVGKSVSRKSIEQIINGQSCYGIDVKVPDMLVATLVKCPVFGGRAYSWQPKTYPGVIAFVEIDSGIAVIAKDYWQASKGAKALKIKWLEGDNKEVSSENLIKAYTEKLKEPGHVITDNGSADVTISASKNVIQSDYNVPFMAHVTMEPVNATAYVTADSCKIWAPTQTPDKVQKDVSKLLALPLDKVIVNVTMVGGGFGRKSYRDFIIEAVQVSKVVGSPVKLIRSRESDIQNSIYRPACSLRMRASIDSKGVPEALHFRASGPSVLKYWNYPEIGKPPEDVDYITILGIHDSPYNIAHFKSDAHTKNIPDVVPVGILRSIAHSYTCFARECFIDELAHKAKQDPLAYRLRMLDKNPRAAAVLKMAAEKSSWGKQLPPGHFQGCALFTEAREEDSYYTYNAQVAEVSIEAGSVVVHKVVTVGDFGKIIHPDLVKNQLEGAVIFAMSLSLFDEITLHKGRVKQSNFHDYRVARMNDAPIIESYLIPSTSRPSGVGEKGVPALIPAVCNAILMATGKHIRQLPVNLARKA
jgi:isoquinoline 1-oxidoreductase beta subunit